MDSRIFYLNYTNVKFAQSVMMIIANDANIFIDNGFGTVLAGDEFIQKMNVAPDWNWRTDI